MHNPIYIDAKSIIQSNNNFNLTKGCNHGCIYCDSRSTCYQNGLFDQIKIKVDAIPIMDKELSKKRQKTILTTGGMNDPYISMPESLELTRNALKTIYKHGFGVSILTKSDQILRDLPLIKDINHRYKAIVQMTVTTTDDALAAKIEPNVTRPSKRFACLKEFSKIGIKTGLWMTPLLPFITDTEENIKDIIKQAHEAGVSFIVMYGIGTTMREGSREYFYNRLDKLFPGMKHRYIYHYKDEYICDSPKALDLQKVFEEACEEYGILYKSEEIEEKILCKPFEQLSLFP
jgi:DNA repair photolyase